MYIEYKSKIIFSLVSNWVIISFLSLSENVENSSFVFLSKLHYLTA